MTPETLARLAEAQRNRQLAVLATRLPDGAQILLQQRQNGLAPADIEAAMPVGLLAAAETASEHERSQSVVLGTESWFLHVHAPPPRLLVIGAVHVAQALAPLARMVGLAVIVIDPRESFATPERFPGTELMTVWPDDALRAVGIDRHSAVVTLTHDPKLDDPALDIALASPAFYVGALGSRKTQNARRNRLREAGHDETALARVRGPVGLPIGAIGAPEIALSILAEIVAVRRGAALANRRSPQE
jgi:xanthine dehydrogenase accessory factor